MTRSALRSVLLASVFPLATFAAVRIWLISRIETYGPKDWHLRFVTDVAIHSLRLKVGFDAIVLLLAGFAIWVVCSVRRETGAVGIAVGATLISVACSVSVVYYPALILSGRLGSIFSTTLSQTLAAWAVVTTVLVATSFLLWAAARVRRIRR